MRADTVESSLALKNAKSQLISVTILIAETECICSCLSKSIRGPVMPIYDNEGGDKQIKIKN